MKRRLVVAILAIAIALVGATVDFSLFLAIDAAPAQAFRIPSDAMAPALLEGDYFTIRGFRNGASRALRRGQIVAHTAPVDPSKSFIKRIVGLPGDTLAMSNGALRRNNRIVAEPYAGQEDTTADPAIDDFLWQRAYLVGAAAHDTSHYIASRDNWGPIVVPADNYFVLGDNRTNSFDSRYWGFVPVKDMLGEVRRVYFSRDSLGHIRWSRLGHHPE